MVIIKIKRLPFRIYCLVGTASKEALRSAKELKWKTKKSQQHQEFPSGLPSKYYPGPMLLNFSDRTRTGVFNMVWPLARGKANFTSYNHIIFYKNDIIADLFWFKGLHILIVRISFGNLVLVMVVTTHCWHWFTIDFTAHYFEHLLDIY